MQMSLRPPLGQARRRPVATPIRRACRHVCEGLEPRTLLSVVANDYAFSTFVNAPFTIQPSDLLANDSGATLMTSIGSPQTGLLAQTANGGFQYTPQAVGTDTIQYTVQGNGIANGLMLELQTGTQDSFIPLEEMDWGVSGPPTAGQAPQIAVALTCQAGRWSPGLFAAVATASPVERAVITHRSATGQIDEVWTLRNAFVTSYSTSAADTNGANRFELQCTQFDFSWLNTDQNGSVLSSTGAGWDLGANTPTQTTAFVPSTAPAGSANVLDLGSGADLAVTGYAWGSDATKQSLNGLSFSGPSGVESPALLSAVLNRTTLPEVTLTSTANGTTIHWDLKNVLVASVSQGVSGGGSTDYFTLQPTELSETVTSAKGVQRAVTLVSPTRISAPSDFGGQPAGSNALWLDFRDSTGASLGSVRVQSMQWGEGTFIVSGNSVPSFGQLTVTSSAGLESPALIAYSYSGKVIPQVVITNTDAAGVQTVWTLRDVLIANASLSGSPGASSESAVMGFGRIDVSRTAGGVTASAGYDLAARKYTSVASFGGSDLSAAQDGTIVHLASGGDIAVDGITWGSSSNFPSGGNAVFGDFALSAASGPESVALFSASVRGTVLPLVTITERKAGVTEVQWQLTNVLVSSYSTAVSDGASDSFALRPQSVTEVLGGNKATWNVYTNSGTTSPNFGGQTAINKLRPTLTLLDAAGNDLGTIAVDSFAWETSAAGSRVDLSSVQLNAMMNSASPGIFASVCDGVGVAHAELTERNSNGQVTAEYSFDGVNFNTDSLSGGSSSALPEESFTMAFRAVHFALTPFNPLTPPTTNAFGYQNGGSSTAQAEFVKSDTTAVLQLELTDGTNLSVDSWTWGESYAVQIAADGTVTHGPLSFSDFNLVLRADSQGPAVDTAIARQTIFGHVVLKALDMSGQIVEQWDLQNVTIVADSTSPGENDAITLRVAGPITETVNATIDGAIVPYSATFDPTTGAGTTPDFGEFVPADGSVAVGTITIDVIAPASITGVVFNDVNHDGVMETNRRAACRLDGLPRRQQQRSARPRRGAGNDRHGRLVHLRPVAGRAGGGARDRSRRLGAHDAVGSGGVDQSGRRADGGRARVRQRAGRYGSDGLQLPAHPCPALRQARHVRRRRPERGWDHQFRRPAAARAELRAHASGPGARGRGIAADCGADGRNDSAKTQARLVLRHS